MRKPSCTGLVLLFVSSAIAGSDPQLITAIPVPEYSAIARQAGIEGEVQLSIVIGADGGSPKRIEVTRPLGWGLDEEAAKAVAHWQFRPAESNGLPIESTTKVECHFAGVKHGDVNFGAMTFDLPAGTVKPILTFFSPPDFVQQFKGSTQTGKVSFTVGGQGEPENFHLEIPPSQGLETAVLESLRYWRFKPAIKDGHPVPIRGSLVFKIGASR